MNMYFTLLFIVLALSLIVNVYQALSKTEISVENGLKWLKKSSIRMVVSYQANYSGSDQLVLLARWIDNSRAKIKKAPPEQLKLFKELINEL